MKIFEFVFWLFLFIAFFICSCTPFNCKDWVEKEIKQRQIRGLIIAKYETQPCFANIVLSSRDTLKDICICGLHTDFWKDTQLNDTLIKNKGEIMVRISRLNHVKEYVYPCCDE